ncbi:hypothetical protein D3C72_1459340 [compost metagenome]
MELYRGPLDRSRASSIGQPMTPRRSAIAWRATVIGSWSKPRSGKPSPGCDVPACQRARASSGVRWRRNSAIASRRASEPYSAIFAPLPNVLASRMPEAMFTAIVSMPARLQALYFSFWPTVSPPNRMTPSPGCGALAWIRARTSAGRAASMLVSSSSSPNSPSAAGLALGAAMIRPASRRRLYSCGLTPSVMPLASMSHFQAS